MRLTLMRHALAALSGPWSDADRPLTAEGEAQAQASARGLSCLELELDVIHTSPARRCRHTADIVAETLGMDDDRIEVRDDLGLESSSERLVAALQDMRNTSVLWVGHQPVLERLAARLLVGQVALPLSLLPAACLGLHCRVKPGREPQAALLWFMRSHELSLLRPEADDRCGPAGNASRS